MADSYNVSQDPTVSSAPDPQTYNIASNYGGVGLGGAAYDPVRAQRVLDMLEAQRSGMTNPTTMDLTPDEQVASQIGVDTTTSPDLSPEAKQMVIAHRVQAKLESNQRQKLIDDAIALKTKQKEFAEKVKGLAPDEAAAEMAAHPELVSSGHKEEAAAPGTEKPKGRPQAPMAQQMGAPNLSAQQPPSGDLKAMSEYAAATGNEEMMRQIAARYGEQGVQTYGEAAKAKEAERQTAITQEADMQKKLLDEHQKIASNLAQQRDNDRAAFNWAQEELKTTEGRMDPERFWKNSDGTRNWAKTIVAAISVAMAEFGRVLTKGNVNNALEIVNGQVAKDIDAQKTEWQQKKEKREELKSAYAMSAKAFSDEDARYLGASALARQATDSVLARMAASTSDKQVEAQLNAMRQANAAKMAEDIAQAHAKQDEKHFKNAQLQLDQAKVAIMAGQTQAELMKSQGEAASKPENATIPGYVRSGKATPNASSLTAAQNSVAAANEANKAIADIEGFRDAHSGGTWDRKAVGEAKILKQRLKSAFANLNKSARMLGKDETPYDKLIPDPDAIFEPGFAGRLKGLRDWANSTADADADVAGFTRAEKAAGVQTGGWN